MSKRIRRFAPFQTAKIFGLIYMLMGLLVLPFFWMGSRAATAAGGPAFPFGGKLLLFVPLIYGVLGFVIVALTCLLYNLVAGWVGGIEVEVEERQG